MSVPDPTDEEVFVSIDVPDNFVSLAPQLDGEGLPVLDLDDQPILDEETYVIGKEWDNGGQLTFIDYLGEIRGYLNYWVEIEMVDEVPKLSAYGFELRNSDDEWIGATNADLLNNIFNSELRESYTSTDPDSYGKAYYWDAENYDGEDFVSGLTTSNLSPKNLPK